MGLCTSSPHSLPPPTTELSSLPEKSIATENGTTESVFVFDPIKLPTAPTTPASLRRDTFMKRIANKMRSTTVKVHDFKPSIDFLTIISSPTTHFDVYGYTLLSEVIRTISCEYCFLNMVDDVREQVLSCYFPKLNTPDTIKHSSNSKRRHQQDMLPSKPFFWVTPFGTGLVSDTCKNGHPYNLEDARRHRLFANGKKENGDWPPILQNVVPTSYCIQPIRYNGDETRIIGAITVVNKDGSKSNESGTEGSGIMFSRRDVMQLLQICLQVSDSMYRQRIRAIESNGDSDAR